MASCVLYTAKREDGRLLFRALHERAAYLMEDGLDCRTFQRVEEAVSQLRSNHTEAIAWDVSLAESLAALPEARACCRDAFLLILASADTSPLAFLRPEIAPSSLILYPLGPAEVNRVACEILQSFRKKEDGCFIIERKGERRQIPWESIYYFESREKKIFARLRGAEIGFTGTLESVEGELPRHFQRCHRSFIVNLEKVDKVRFAENRIELWDGLEVPLSRGYKRSVRERGSGRI